MLKVCKKLNFALQKLFHGYSVYSVHQHEIPASCMEHDSPFAVIAKETITKAEIKTDLTLKRLLSFIGSEIPLTIDC